MEKQKIIEHLNDINQTKVIKIQDSDKTRRIFEGKKAFEIFGGVEGVLNPFNDYTYEWLNSFLCSVIDFVGYTDFDDFDELADLIKDILPEWVDSEVSVYTYDLTEWLHSNNNVYYMTEVTEEYGTTDGFNLLQQAQYKAIDEVYNNALGLLIDNLKDNFE